MLVDDHKAVRCIGCSCKLCKHTSDAMWRCFIHTARFSLGAKNGEPPCSTSIVARGGSGRSPPSIRVAFRVPFACKAAVFRAGCSKQVPAAPLHPCTTRSDPSRPHPQPPNPSFPPQSLHLKAYPLGCEIALGLWSTRRSSLAGRSSCSPHAVRMLSCLRPRGGAAERACGLRGSRCVAHATRTHTRGSRDAWLTRRRRQRPSQGRPL